MNEAMDYNLSKDEDETFTKFKRIFNQLEDNPENEFLLYRFLKEHKFDVNKAQTMLNKHLEFRRKHKLDTILEDYKPKEPMASYYAVNNLGFDKEGSPVGLLDAGNTDFIGLIKSVKKDDFVKHVLYRIEYVQRLVLEQSLKLKKPRLCVFIVDHEKTSLAKILSKSVVQLSIEIICMADMNYPGLTQVIHVINAPVYFSYVFNIWKTFVQGELVQTMNVHSSKDDWLPELLKHMGPEMLPAYLGGEKTDPDGNPKCVKVLLRGKPVPKYYYLDHSVDHLYDQPDVEKYSLGSRSKINITHEVDISGSFLEWQFESENHDIGFGLLFKTQNDENPRELIPIERVKANVQREVGTFMCVEPGTYIMVLDNSYSWIRGKHVFIKSSVRKPRELTEPDL